MSGRAPWNANIQYHPLLTQAVPEHATNVLDVGCGDGLLSVELCRPGRRVVALDVDPGVLDRARAAHPGASVEWLRGDVFSYPFEPASFDAVVSLAALHHFDAAHGLRRFAELVRPGGVVAVVGLADAGLADLPRGVLAGLTTALMRVRKQFREPSAPKVWPPATTFSEIHKIAQQELPGVAYKRLLLGRYSLYWRRPAS